MDVTYAALASVLILTAAAALARTFAKVSVCPICAGVSVTWGWLLLARWAGVGVDPTLLAVLIGGSAVAGAGWVESRLPAGRSPMWWKALAVPPGLVAAYGLAAERWIVAAVAIGFVLVLLAVFMRGGTAGAADPSAVTQLEERMKQCC